MAIGESFYSIKELSALRDKLQNNSVDFGQAYSQCMACPEDKVKLACPVVYQGCLNDMDMAKAYQESLADMLEGTKASQRNASDKTE